MAKAVLSDIEAPGEGDLFDGWRAHWSSRVRPYFAEEYDPTDPLNWDRSLVRLHEPILTLSKEGRKWVEVKGQSEVDRPIMLARGMTAAMLCDAHYAREWGDIPAALQFEADAERWHRLAQVRANTRAVQRVGARMLIGPAGSGAKGNE